MIKLVAFDIDGTLRDRDYIPESTREALQQLKENGIQLVLCTGRCEFEIKSLWEQLNIDWAITCNGTHIGHRGETIMANAFPKETVQHWLQIAKSHGHALLLTGAKGMFLSQKDDHYFRRAQVEIGWLEPELISCNESLPDIYQCIVFCDEAEQGMYLGGHPENYYTHKWRTWAMDINPGGINKAVGLRKLLDYLHISPLEAAAFGDGLNDFEMLTSVHMGIAMGNASDELQRKARYVTKSIYENGIAYAVNKWILKE